MTPQHKLIAATVAVAVLAGGGAALAAVELTSSSSGAAPAVTAPLPAEAGYGLGTGMLGGRGFGGGVGPAGLRGGGDRPPGGWRFLGAGLAAAAVYLGVPATTVSLDLAAGETLAQVAQSQRKTVGGLVAAILAAEKLRLTRAVAAGRLTRAQADALAARLQTETTAFVDGGPPAGPPAATTT